MQKLRIISKSKFYHEAISNSVKRGSEMWIWNRNPFRIRIPNPSRPGEPLRSIPGTPFRSGRVAPRTRHQWRRLNGKTPHLQ